MQMWVLYYRSYLFAVLVVLLAVVRVQDDAECERMGIERHIHTWEEKQTAQYEVTQIQWQIKNQFLNEQISVFKAFLKNIQVCF